MYREIVPYPSMKRALVALLLLAIALPAAAQRFYADNGKYEGRFDGERWYSSTGEFVLRISGERMYLSNGTFEARMQGNRLYKANGEYIGRMQDDRFLPGQWRIHRAFGWGSVLRFGWALLGPDERREQSPRLLVLLQTSRLLSEPPSADRLRYFLRTLLTVHRGGYNSSGVACPFPTGIEALEFHVF